MKPASLSVRLGLAVGAMGAVLVVVLALLAAYGLDGALDARAREALESKLKQIEHGLALDLGNSLRPHVVGDQIKGHDDLSLALFDARTGGPVRLELGRLPLSERLRDLPAGPEVRYRTLYLEDGSEVLAAYRELVLPDGQAVRLFLNLDRRSDRALLAAYLRSALATLPLVLLLIGCGAWLVVQRGLAPLARFRRVAAKVSTEDLSHRLPVASLPRELGELAQSINLMLHRLDGGVQQLAQFSDDLAHELRSPISNLMGQAQVTLSRERPPEAYKAVLECCTEELERLARIVTDMLFLAQVSHPAALVPMTPLDLGAEARRVADLFALPADDKQQVLVVEGEGQVLGDRLMVQRALSNLLSNAIRHSPPRSCIHLEARREGDSLVMAVRNPGPGIPAQHLPHLFERFYRVDPGRARADGGTGLGLAIVRSIMSLHRGSVEVSSEPAGPTEFRLRFPAAGG